MVEVRRPKVVTPKHAGGVQGLVALTDRPTIFVLCVLGVQYLEKILLKIRKTKNNSERSRINYCFYS